MADGDQESFQAEFTQKRSELRQYPRKHFAKPVVFISDNQYHRGVARNLSRRGIFIAIKDKFYVGQSIKLVIPGTKIDNGVMLKGEIVHFSQMGIGVNFKSLIRRRQIIKDRGGTRSGDDRRKLFFSEYSPEKRTGEERRSGGDRRSLEHVVSRKTLNLSDAFRSLK